MSPIPLATPTDLLVGQVVVTVSDGLRVRSEPRVSDDSIKYEPLLPLDTELTVVGGPVYSSGYVWYEVTPVSFALRDGQRQGWVALAGKDGEPWIALANPPIAGIEVAQADASRAPADPAAAKTAGSSINALGLDLLQAMLADGSIQPNQNAVFSPTSIALALAMALAGAKGETATQMDAVLHTKGWDDLGPGLNALDQALASDAMTWQDEEGKNHEVTLKIANSLFAQQGWLVEPAYLTRIAETFGGGVRLVDYIADAGSALKLINAWVSNQTRQRIPHLIPDGVLTDITRLVLVNAIYLKANWAREFQLVNTKNLPFTRLDGSQVNVPTMQQGGGQEIPYAHGTGWQATELLYGIQNAKTPLAMTLIMPDDLSAFERQLTQSELGRINDAVGAQREMLSHVTYDPALAEMDCGHYAYEVGLGLPRFSAESKAELPGVLKALGMPLAFSGAADFGAIHVATAQEGPIHIGDVIHQANIDVDEKGTTAAAATALTFDTGGCTGPSPTKTITFRLDHPFMFVLRDVETGAVLFIGHVVDPSVGR